MKGGKVLWLTGLPGSGKTTIAAVLSETLEEKGIQTLVLDGDQLRRGLCSDLGYSREDRIENIRRASELAKLAYESGIFVIAALITPFRVERERIRMLIRTGDFIEVYCKCPVEVCKLRDPKGMYALAEDGKLAEFTGISSPYEPPLNPDIELETDKEQVGQSLSRITDYLRNIQGVAIS